MSKETAALALAAALTGAELIHIVQGGNSRQVSIDALAAAMPPGQPGANVIAIPTFAALGGTDVPAGTTLIHTAAYDAGGRGHAWYVENAALTDADVAAHPRARKKSQNGRYWELSREQQLNPYQFGATGKGATNVDDGPAFAAADAWFATIATDPSTGGYYTGSLPFHIEGDFFLNVTTLQPRYSIDWIGAGPGHFWGGGASSRMRWASGVHGVIPQGPQTTGTDDVSVPTLQGCPLFKARGIRFEGGYHGDQAQEGLWHALVPRVPYFLEDCHFYGWEGTGLRAWAGNIIGGANVGGNVSESVIIRCKFENCYVGRSNKGSDANVVRAFGPTYYQNRLKGFEDDNGAGSNVELAPHFAFNGRIANPNYWTQCATGGYRYALRVGGNKANAPSGGPTTTADWAFIEAGSSIPNDIPAYDPALDFRVGGDGITLNSAATHFIQYYSEYGGFSQFNDYTVVDNGTLLPQYYIGGWHLAPQGGDGYALVSNKVNCTFFLDNNGPGVETSIWARKNGVAYALIDFIYNAYNLYRTNGTSGHVFQGAGNAEYGRIDPDGIKVPAATGFWVNGQRVVQARQAAIAPAVHSVAAPTQAEFNAAVDVLNTALTTIQTHGLTA